MSKKYFKTLIKKFTILAFFFLIAFILCYSVYRARSSDAFNAADFIFIDIFLILFTYLGLPLTVASLILSIVFLIKFRKYYPKEELNNKKTTLECSNKDGTKVEDKIKSKKEEL